MTHETLSAVTGKPIKPAQARTEHPETSHVAAARVDVTKGQALVLRSLRVLGTATGNQIRDDLRRRGIQASESGPRSRCAALVEAGLMYVVRHADKHAVFGLTDAGKAKAEELFNAARQEKARLFS